MPDYSKGIIYTIRYRNDDSLIYVGSTIQPLYKRWHEHKTVCFNEKRKGYNRKIYQKIRETNDVDNWYIELYESYPCANKDELNKREGEVIREIANLNTQIAGRTKQEYRDNNKDKIKDYNKEYREQNKDKIKEYRDTNNKIIKDKNKEYRENNKDKILEKRKEKMTCDCGGVFRISDKSKHYKSKKHEEYLNSL